ncbi:MAG: tetratricopeptide repeat protein [Myxococcaceae bacterium]
MRILIAAILILAASPVLAQDRKAARETELKKEQSAAPDKSLAGDITRKKAEKGEAAPALQYDHFRLGVEVQLASKRAQQIEDLKKIISLSQDGSKEKPDLLFRLAELYFEESKHQFFEANRKDDEYIRAMNAGDKAGQERAKAEKEAILKKSKGARKLAIDQYAEIVQRYKDYARTDEVLYFLGHSFLESGEDRKALVSFDRLIKKYKKSKYIPDAYLAFGEYYFTNSKGKRDQLEKALEYYKLAEGFPENQVYAFAIYKQGWCYFNLGEYERALDKFKAVVLYGQFAGAAAVEKDGNAKKKGTLIKEARSDYVRAYARSGRPALDARADFGKVASNDDERFTMLKHLANLYYEDGKDKEAALTFNTLIKERPNSPEAPGFQGKIVDCVLRAGNKKMTVDQVRRLVTIHDSVVKSGMIKDEKDKQALEEARELSERTLSNLAVNWHNEAKKTRDDETFAFAHEVYSDYLRLFSDNKKAYDLRFFYAELLNDNLNRYEKSSEQYTLVVAQDIKRIEKGEKPGKWLNNAAYNAVLAWDEVVKNAEQNGSLKNPDTSDPTRKAEIPSLKKQLLEASERYLKYVPNGDKKVEIAFKAANIYYRYNHFDEAVKRFADVAENHQDYKFENGDRAAEMAANLILDTFNLQNDWGKVNEWARRFYKDPKLATGKFRDDLSQVIEQSAFKLVNQLEAKKEYAKAADAYLAFVSEFPKSSIADKALFNASIDFYNAKMLDRAIEVRKQIIARYPKSEFVPQCIFANAEASEAIGDFEDAAESYELYVRGYEKSHEVPTKKAAKRSRRGGKARAAKAETEGSKLLYEETKAQIALFNAGVFRDGLGQYRQALRNRERYLELWPKSKDAEAVFLSIADLHEKNGAWTKALKHLEEYEREYMRDADKVLMAEGRIAAIYVDKLKNDRNARRIYNRIWDYYEKLPGRVKKKLDNAALDAVARAHYELSDEDWREFSRRKIQWGQGRWMADHFKKTLQEKAKALEAVQKRYTQTVAFKSGPPALCALSKIGDAYAHMAESVVNAPMPKGAPPELQDALREELAGQAQPLKDKAAEAYAAAVAKGQELDVFSECFKSALTQLRETYRPDAFPHMYEDTVSLKNMTTAVLGGDLLDSVQPIPVVTAAQAAELKEKAAELKDDLSDLDTRPASATSDREPAAGEGEDEEDSDEPEDLL